MLQVPYNPNPSALQCIQSSRKGFKKLCIAYCIGIRLAIKPGFVSMRGHPVITRFIQSLATRYVHDPSQKQFGIIIDNSLYRKDWRLPYDKTLVNGIVVCLDDASFVGCKGTNDSLGSVSLSIS